MGEARYSRQIPLIGEEGQERLGRSSVAVVGLGGIGSPLSLLVAAAGVGRIRLVDWDLVELSNLNRQILYTSRDLMRPKPFVAAERISLLNPRVEVEVVHEPLVPGNADSIVEGVDLVLDALDSLEARLALGDACQRAGAPHTYAAVQGLFGLVTLIVPGETPCLRCILPERPREEPAFTVGPVPALVASVSASEAIRILSGRGPSLAGRMLVVDLSSPSFEFIELSGECPHRPPEPPPRPAYFRRGDRLYAFEADPSGWERLERRGWAVVEESDAYVRLSGPGSVAVFYSDGGALLVGSRGEGDFREAVGGDLEDL
ncbi:MAG: adenylyltransferase [Thermoproteota archaeon]|nr:MAG: adenylyltransferase [Candidatus Korarchaeota archaeon]